MTFTHAAWTVVRFLDVIGLLLALLGGSLFAYAAIKYLSQRNLGPEGALPSVIWRSPMAILGKHIFVSGIVLAVSMFVLRLVLPGAG